MKHHNSNKKKLSSKIHRQSTVGKYFGIIILVVLIDQLTKRYVATNIVKNEGILFGLNFANSNTIMIGASIAAAGILAFFLLFIHLQGKTFYSLIIGGILGNLIDRMTLGYVVDWIRVSNFPVFNVADACISVSVVLLIIYSLWEGRVYRASRDRLMSRLRH